MTIPDNPTGKGGEDGEEILQGILAANRCISGHHNFAEDTIRLVSWLTPSLFGTAAHKSERLPPRFLCVRQLLEKCYLVWCGNYIL